jgi:hypothetical protein
LIRAEEEQEAQEGNTALGRENGNIALGREIYQTSAKGNGLQSQTIKPL